MASDGRRKTSLTIDFRKVDAAKRVLGTTTLTSTIDAALDEVVRQRNRQRLVQMLFDGEELDLDDEEVMAGAWR
jgi:hypothetical protein